MTTESTTTAAPAKELTSEKLVQLKAQFAEAWAKMAGISDPFSKEAKDAKLETWKIEGEMKAELANLQKAENEARIAEQRNERLKLNQNQLDAHAALLALKGDKKATAEQIAEAQTAFDTAKEAVDNELLAKYAGSKSAAKVADGTAKEAGEKGKDRAAIIELYLAGKEQKEIIEAGYARSTVWHAINDYKKANGLK